MSGLSEVSTIFQIEEPYREQAVESGGVEYNWAADIETYPEGSEVTMIYRFPEEKFEGLRDYVSEENQPYENPFTSQELFPAVGLGEDAKVVLWAPPPERPVEHEFGYFPGQYLEELRDDFFEELRPFLD